MGTPLRILVFAYACEPTHGSEPGAGWLWARMLASVGETWVVTRANNRAAIEAALSSIPERNSLHFVFVDLPSWASFWKRGQRGIRLYYVLWQLVAAAQARRLHGRQPFTLVWHVTLANAWLGSGGPLVGARFIYGPIGGGIGAPWRAASMLGVRGVTYEAMRGMARLIGRYLNPLARLALRRADLILVQNPETRDWLPRRYRDKARVFPNIVLDVEFGGRSRQLDRPTAVFAGRLLPWKGVALGLRALAALPDWRFLVYGRGPCSRRLARLAMRLEINDRVEFRGWAPRADVVQAMLTEADVLLFPSLHEDAGWIVVEALAAGLPVVCVDRGGPPVLVEDAGRAVQYDSTERMAEALASALARSLTSQNRARLVAEQYLIARRSRELRRQFI